MEPEGGGVMEDYRECRLCPRDCRVDRTSGRKGFCGEGARPRLAWAGLHRGEEPPLAGERGSGTVFFPGCTLRCSCCQNRVRYHADNHQKQDY